MKGHGSKFDRKKEALIAALISQKNIEEAARATGINLKTAKRWMRMPEFVSEYRRVRWELVDQAYARAQQNSGAATTVLLSSPWLQEISPIIKRCSRAPSHTKKNSEIENNVLRHNEEVFLKCEQFQSSP